MSLIKVILVTISLSFYSFLVFGDAPHEKFMSEYKNIRPESLKRVKGVLEIEFRSDMSGAERLPSAILGYSQGGISDTITIGNSKAVTGIDYTFISRKYPVDSMDGFYCRIVYDLEKNLKTWVYLYQGFVRTIHGEYMPANLFMFNNKSSLSANGHNVDLFTLLNSSRRKVYAAPDPGSYAGMISIKGDFSGFRLEDQRSPGTSSEFERVRIYEIKDGFAKLYSNYYDEEGSEKEAFIGWVRIFDSSGRLTIWPMHFEGC